MLEIRFRNPHRRISAGLALNAHNSEILGIDPDLSAVQEPVFCLGLQRENVARAFWRALVSRELEIVVIPGQGGFRAIVALQHFLFAFQKFLENMINHELGAALGNDRELFGIGSLESNLYRHLSVVVAEETSILHA